MAPLQVGDRLADAGTRQRQRVGIPTERADVDAPYESAHGEGWVRESGPWVDARYKARRRQQRSAGNVVDLELTIGKPRNDLQLAPHRTDRVA